MNFVFPAGGRSGLPAFRFPIAGSRTRQEGVPPIRQGAFFEVLLRARAAWVIVDLKFMERQIVSVIGDIYEDLEHWYPKIRLEEAGIHTITAAPTPGKYTGKHGYPAEAQRAVSDISEAEFEGLLIPGGFAPDKLRRLDTILTITRDFFEKGKLVAFICHGGWIPISAKILQGKKCTGSLGIKDDLENAGAIWSDEPVVVDGNLISSRTPQDLAPFAAAMIQFLNRPKEDPSK